MHGNSRVKQISLVRANIVKQGDQETFNHTSGRGSSLIRLESLTYNNQPFLGSHQPLKRRAGVLYTLS